MKAERPYPALSLSERAAQSLEEGAFWVYAGETDGEPEAENGAVVDLVDARGKYVATALWSQKSKLRYRVLTRNASDRVDEAFWRRRLSYALDYRWAVMQPEERDAMRLIFGEADGFPGLTCDLYHDILVVQNLSYGLENRKDSLYPLLAQLLEERGRPLRAIYEKNDLALREKEGLPRTEAYYALAGQALPEQDEVEIQENGLRLIVPYGAGQKTGYFLDQKRNRRAFARLAKGRRVLECFSNSASFGLNALAAGADFVLSVDSSRAALDLAERQSHLNGFTEERHQVLKADVLQLLEALVEHKNGPDWEQARAAGPYDLILLDPPAFAKKRADIAAALAAYTEINRRAMQLLPRGGYLATCTCSHFAGDREFRKALRQAARLAKRELRQIEERRQAPDHPILWNAEESSYLKFYLFQVV